MRGGWRHCCGQDAADLCARVQQATLPEPAAYHSRTYRVGHRPVPDIQGRKYQGGPIYPIIIKVVVQAELYFRGTTTKRALRQILLLVQTSGEKGRSEKGEMLDGSVA